LALGEAHLIEQAQRQLEVALEPALVALEARLRASDESAASTQLPSTSDSASLCTELEALALALESSDIQIFDLYDTLLTRHDKAWHDALAPLQRAMAVFDTERAHAEASALINVLRGDS